MFLFHIATKGRGRIHTPSKPLEYSSMTYNEEHDLSSQVFKLEQWIKGSVKTFDLTNLHEYLMKFLMQSLDESVSKSVNVAQGDHKDGFHVEQPSINKHIQGGLDLNNVNNQGWSPRGLQLPKIDISKFDRKEPITWIFHMEQLFLYTRFHIDKR